MADIKIRVVGEDAASKEFEKVNKSLEDMKKEAGDAGDGGKDMGINWSMALMGINMGLEIAQKAIEAFKKAYEFAREGAELEYLETKFNNLATSIGTTSNALLVDLKSATRGLMSDSELMAGATNMMALGLASSHEEAVRLTAAAAALNMNMDQLTLTLTNKTTRRFDTLGISVAGFTEKVKALEDAGMSADDAFKEAFLQQAEAQIERVGHAADSAIGDFNRLESAITTMSDNAKKSLLTVLHPAIKAVADGLVEAAEFQSIYTMALEEGIISQAEYERAMILAKYSSIDFTEAIIELREQIIQAAKNQAFGAEQAKGYAAMSMLAAGATWEEINALYEFIAIELDDKTHTTNFNKNDPYGLQNWMPPGDTKSTHLFAFVEHDPYYRNTGIPGTGTENEYRIQDAAGGAIHAASGIPVHWVGEMGPEPFIPAMSGRIVSNTQAVQVLRESRGGNGEGLSVGELVEALRRVDGLGQRHYHMTNYFPKESPLSLAQRIRVLEAINA